jgi:hypothetical protein
MEIIENKQREHREALGQTTLINNRYKKLKILKNNEDLVIVLIVYDF